MRRSARSTVLALLAALTATLLASPARAAVALLRVGEHARLHTTLIVREDSLTLYGFADVDERETFETVQTVSGIGPRTVEAIRLQVNSVLSRSARRRARRVRRQTLQMAASTAPATTLRKVETASAVDPEVGAPPMATIYTLFPPAAA